MDEILHGERLAPDGQRVLFTSTVADLPDGAFLLLDDEPWLLAHGRVHRWSPGGYTNAIVPPSGTVTVLTPRCTVEVIAGGYSPQFDGSARAR